MSNPIQFEHSVTNIFYKILEALMDPSIHTIINEGGSSSSKTYSNIQILAHFANLITIPHLISITSESFPHLEAGAIRDFKSIMAPVWDDNKWNATKHFYKFNENSTLEFFASDSPGKAHGPRRNILYCNEVNNISKPIVDAMLLRTKGKALYDFNPVAQFWAHDLRGMPGVAWIHSTYLDSKMFLPKRTIERIESLKYTDPNAWRVYGLGLIGKIEGLVYPDFEIIDEMPVLANKMEIFGLDFGWTDPCALVKNTISENKCYSEELVYETKLHMRDLSQRMEDLGMRKNYDVIIADSEDPGRIDELCGYGWNVKKCIKGPGSVEFGHQKVRQYKQFWTKKSINGIKSQRNFMYIKNTAGDITEKTTHLFSHCFASDTLVLTSNGWKKIIKIKNGDNVASYDLQNKKYVFSKTFGHNLVDNNTSMMCLRVSNVDACRCTLDHNFLTEQGWVQAKDLKENSILVGDSSCKIIEECQCSLKSMEQNSGLIKKQGIIMGICATKNGDYIKQFTKTKLGLFQKASTNVNPSGEGKQALTILNRFVQNAKNLFRLIDIQNKNSVRVHVLQKAVLLNKKESVYCLEVENTHTFIIYPGVVVKNSMDARRYAITGLGEISGYDMSSLSTLD